MTNPRPIPEVLPTSENASDGILVVLFPGLGPQSFGPRRGTLFDNSVDHGQTLERFCAWFDVWGIPVHRVRGSETAFEKSFFAAEWPADPAVYAGAHGPQMVSKIAARTKELALVLQERRPRLVIFLSCYLWQAANHPDALEILKPIIGNPLETGRRITSERLAAYVQPWEKCTFLALPQPSKNTTERYVLSLAAGVQSTLTQARTAAPTCADPLLAQAAEHLIYDRAGSIRSIAAHLHIDTKRAEKLFDHLTASSAR